MKQFSIARAAAIGVLAVMSFPAASKADDYDKKTIITITEPLEVPGIVLQPGKYVFKLLNSSSNRHIVEVMNERMDHLYALTFTAAARKLEPKGRTVLTFYEGKGNQPHAIRQWYWPGDVDGQEFLYPRKQAERISAVAGVKVPEGSIPTAKESGEKLVADNAGKEDSVALESRVVETTPAPATTTVVTAQAAPARAPEPEPRTLALNAEPPAPEPAPQVSVTPPAPQEPVAVAKTETTETLPQTASSLPMIALAGAIALLLAGTMSVFARKERL
jgi:LPXTG-motif cell wall-anchored protein